MKSLPVILLEGDGKIAGHLELKDEVAAKVADLVSVGKSPAIGVAFSTADESGVVLHELTIGEKLPDPKVRAKTMAEMHDGKIRITHERDGQTYTFKLVGTERSYSDLAKAMGQFLHDPEVNFGTHDATAVAGCLRNFLDRIKSHAKSFQQEPNKAKPLVDTGSLKHSLGHRARTKARKVELGVPAPAPATHFGHPPTATLPAAVASDEPPKQPRFDSQRWRIGMLQIFVTCGVVSFLLGLLFEFLGG